MTAEHEWFAWMNDAGEMLPRCGRCGLIAHDKQEAALECMALVGPPIPETQTEQHGSYPSPADIAGQPA